MRPGDARPRNASDAPAGAARALQRAAREGPPELRPSASHGHTRYDDQDRLTGEIWTSTAAGQTPPPCQNNIQDLATGNVSVFAGPVCVTPTSGALLYQASWTYDGSGNRLTQTVNQGPATSYAHDAQNRLTSAGPVGYTYTRNGNQETRTEGGVTESFTYDYMNRVKTYLKGGVSFMYVYMPTGERVTKLNVGAGTEETFFSDGQDVVVDYTRSGGGPLTLARTYANTPSSIDSKLARIEAGGALHFYVGDALGSVHEMMDQAGATVRRELYTAWGEKLPGFAGIDFPDRYAFTQRERDDESSLMHYRARSYDPRLGRFMQREPEELARARAHYLYASNLPTLLSDPSGRWVIYRSDGAEYGAAIPEPEKGDNLVSLSARIGLDEREAKKWLRIFVEDGPEIFRSKRYPQVQLRDFNKHRFVNDFEVGLVGKQYDTAYAVPNVIVNIDTITGTGGFFYRWLSGISPGEMRAHFPSEEGGGAQPANGIAKVYERTPGNSADGVLKVLKHFAQDGKLWAWSINAHGGPDLIIDRSVSSVDLFRAVGYRMARVRIYACNSKDRKWLEVVSKNGKAFGFRRDCIPGSIYGDWPEEITSADTY